MYDIIMTPPLQLLKTKRDELDRLLHEVESPEVACNINSVLVDYKEAIERLEV